MKLLLLAFGKPLFAAAGLSLASVSAVRDLDRAQIEVEGGALLGAGIGGAAGRFEVVPDDGGNLKVIPIPVPADPPAKEDPEEEE